MYDLSFNGAGPEPTAPDSERLLALLRTGLLDTPPEPAFDRLTALARRLLGVPVSLVSLVDERRQFFKSQTGLPEDLACARETPLSHSFCKHVVGGRSPLVVDDARTHPVLKDNPAVRDLNVIAYAGVPLVTPDGHVLGALCAIDGRPRAWVAEDIATLTDLAAAVMAEVELRAQAKALQASQQRLEEAQATREQFVQMLVHDLRNPLASLLSALELVEEFGELAGPQREFFDMARRNGQTLLGMVNDVLDVSRAENSGLALECVPLPAAGLVTQALARVEPLAAAKSVTLALDAAPEAPAVLADEEKITRVLANLLGNAVRFTPAGGRVSISAAADGAALCFAVCDGGPGLPEDVRRVIFEKFNPAARGAGASTGLGLAFCKAVAEAHGGSVAVDSQPGRGSTFSLRVPLAAPPS